MATVSYALTTKEQVKRYLEISVATYDDLIDELINYLTAFIEKECGGRRFKYSPYSNELYDGDNFGSLMLLNQYPLYNLVRLEYNAGNTKTPNWKTVDRDDYEIYEDIGGVYFYNKPLGKRNIRASYYAGYTTIPHDLVFLATRLVARIFEKRKSEGIESESLGGVNVGWDEFLKDEDRKIISNYLRKIV